MKIIPKGGKFVLNLKQNYVKHLPTISKQCVTMLDGILIEHVSARAMVQYS